MRMYFVGQIIFAIIIIIIIVILHNVVNCFKFNFLNFLFEEYPLLIIVRSFSTDIQTNAEMEYVSVPNTVSDRHFLFKW